MKRRIAVWFSISSLIFVVAAADADIVLHRGGPVSLATSGTVAWKVAGDPGDISGGAFFTNQKSGDASCSIALNGVATNHHDATLDVSMLRTDGPCPAPGNYPVVDMLSAAPDGFVTSVITETGSFVATGGTLTITKLNAHELDGTVSGTFKAMESSKTLQLKGSFQAVANP